MDTTTKIILGSLIGLFAVCALLSAIFVGENIALIFTGLATSGMTALAGISYGARLNGNTNIPETPPIDDQQTK